MKIQNKCKVPVRVRGNIVGREVRLNIWISSGESMDIVFGPFSKDHIMCHDDPEDDPSRRVTLYQRIALVRGRFTLYIEHIDDDPLHYA